MIQQIHPEGTPGKAAQNAEDIVIDCPAYNYMDGAQ